MMESESIEERLTKIEKVIGTLCYVLREVDEFWSNTTPEEQQTIADFYDAHREY